MRRARYAGRKDLLARLRGPVDSAGQSGRFRRRGLRDPWRRESGAHGGGWGIGTAVLDGLGAVRGESAAVLRTESSDRRQSRCTGFGASTRAGLRALGGLLIGLAQSIALAVKLDHLETVDEAVDEGDDAGGGGEHVGPLREGFVRMMSTGRERYLRVTTSKIRLFGVDAPESAQSCLAGDRRWPCGREAARTLDGRIGSSRVVCEERDTDRYGRIVAVCRVGGADPARCRTTRHCVESELRIPPPAAIRGPAMAR